MREPLMLLSDALIRSSVLLLAGLTGLFLFVDGRWWYDRPTVARPGCADGGVPVESLGHRR